MQTHTIRLLLDWTLDAKHAVFTEAQAQGYYREAGISLEIMEPAQKSSMALELLHQGEADLVINYPHNIMLMQDRVPGTVSIASLVPSNPEGLLSLKDKGITSVMDIPGKRIGVGPSPVSQAQLEVFLAHNGVPRDAVTWKIVGFEGEKLLLADEIDLLDAVSYAIPRTIRKGKDVNFISYTQHGLPESPFLVFAARKAWVEEHHETAVKFLKATAEGYRKVCSWTLADWERYTGEIPGRNGPEEQEVWELTKALMERTKLFHQDIGEVEGLAALLRDKGILTHEVDCRALFLNLMS